jgi:serine/threonine-protein kinase
MIGLVPGWKNLLDGAGVGSHNSDSTATAFGRAAAMNRRVLHARPRRSLRTSSAAQYSGPKDAGGRLPAAVRPSMTDSQKTEHLTLEPGLAEQMVRVCEEFEAAWQKVRENGGCAPQIDEFLSRLPESDRLTLRRALEEIQQDYRCVDSASSASSGATTIDIPPTEMGTPTATAASDQTIDQAFQLEALSRGSTEGETIDAPPSPAVASPEPSQGDGTVDFFGAEGVPPSALADLGTIAQAPDTAARNKGAVDPSLAQPTFSLAEGILTSAQADRPLVPGYEIVGELGRGGMGVVYKARQKGLNRWVALKMVLAGAHAGPQQLARFRIEAEAIAHLQHPNIVQVYDVGEQAGLPYFSLEFVDGGSLASKVYRQPQPPRDAAHMIETLARAMAYAHEHGIIHRDLKPANVLLTEDGIPKITDFGLAKRLEDDSSQTKSGTLMGTPSYMAPEQARGDVHQVGPLADVYALGAMLYELLTGRPPFLAATPMETILEVTTEEAVPPTRLHAEIPRDLETICLKCLQKEPQKRYAGALELAEDLRRFLSDEPILARPVSNRERLVRWCKRNPKLAVSALGGVVVIVLWAGTASYQWYRIGVANAAEIQQRELAQKNEEIAEEETARATETVRNVLTKVEVKLRDKPEMGGLQLEILDLGKKMTDQLRRTPKTAGLIDRINGVYSQKKGDIFVGQGQNKEATQAYKAALLEFEKLMKSTPEEEWNFFNAAVCYDGLGEIARENEPDPDLGPQYYRQSLELRRQLLDSFKNPEISVIQRQQGMAISHIKMAAMALEFGKPQKAAKDAAKALEWIQEATTGPEPKDPEQRKDYLDTKGNFRVEALLSMARSSGHLEQLEASRRYLLEASALVRELLRAQPMSVRLHRDLSRVHDAMGESQMSLGDTRGALENYQEAHRILQRLAEKDKTDEEGLWFLANADYHLGAAQLASGDRAAAQKSFEDCLATRERHAKEDPENLQRLIELMWARARCGQHAKAQQVGERLSETAAKHPGVQFAVACGYALCRASLNPDASDAPERIRAQRYGDLAMKALPLAIEDGYADLWMLRHAPELESIRKLPGFQDAIDKLSQKSLAAVRAEP